MNRRDFLRPRQLAHQAGQVLGVLGELGPDPSATIPPDLALLRASRRAMATDFEVLVPFGAGRGLDAAEAALDEIDRLEAQLTVYRDDSEVSLINRIAVHGPVTVEPGLFELLQLCKRLHDETDGAFDAAAGALIKTWGFYKRQQRLPTAEERAESLQRVGMRHVFLDAERRQVRLLRPGVELNLGSIGKGYALDRAALLRDDREIPAALLHGGHSSVYAKGKPPGDARGWPIGIRHPWDLQRRLAVVRLADRGLGTSAATFQHLEVGGRKLGHILDPRTGWPAQQMASVSVVAPTAAEADALATAFFILGVARAEAYCATRPDVGAILLPADPAAGPVVLGLSSREVEVLGGD